MAQPEKFCINSYSKEASKNKFYCEEQGLLFKWVKTFPFNFNVFK